jgi:hypothetical protein
MYQLDTLCDIPERRWIMKAYKLIYSGQSWNTSPYRAEADTPGEAAAEHFMECLESFPTHDDIRYATLLETNADSVRGFRLKLIGTGYKPDDWRVVLRREA